MPTTRPSGLVVPEGTDPADFDGTIFPDLAESIEDNFATAAAFDAATERRLLGAGALHPNPSSLTADGNGWVLPDGSTGSVVGYFDKPAGWATYDVVLWLAAGAGAGDVRLRALTNSFSDGGATAAGASATITFATVAVAAFEKVTLASGIAVGAGEVLQVVGSRLGADGADTLAAGITAAALEIVKAS